LTHTLKRLVSTLEPMKRKTGIKPLLSNGEKPVSSLCFQMVEKPLSSLCFQIQLVPLHGVDPATAAAAAAAAAADAEKENDAGEANAAEGVIPPVPIAAPVVAAPGGTVEFTVKCSYLVGLCTS
jgi:hypothetical protein